MVKKLVIAMTLFFGLLATANATTFDVSLDGYCNTFALTLSGFEIYGTRGGCGYTVNDAGANVHISGSPYRMTADTNDGSTMFNWFFTPPKSHKGSWYLYSSDGSSYTLVNSGTYTRTGAPVTRKRIGKDITAGLSKGH